MRGHVDEVCHFGIRSLSVAIRDDFDIGVWKIAPQRVNHTQRRIASGSRAEDNLNRCLVILKQKTFQVLFKPRFVKMKRLEESDRNRHPRRRARALCFDAKCKCGRRREARRDKREQRQTGADYLLNCRHSALNTRNPPRSHTVRPEESTQVPSIRRFPAAPSCRRPLRRPTRPSTLEMDMRRILHASLLTTTMVAVAFTSATTT